MIGHEPTICTTLHASRLPHAPRAHIGYELSFVITLLWMHLYNCFNVYIYIHTHTHSINFSVIEYVLTRFTYSTISIMHAYKTTYLHMCTHAHIHIQTYRHTLHYITLHKLHYITLNYIKLHYITLHYIHTYVHTHHFEAYARPET